MYETTAVLDLPSELERQAPIGMASEVAGVVGWTLVGNERSGLPQAINVETDPDVRSLRESVREEAQAIMDAHVRSLCEGEYDQVPMEADAGGTARKLVALGKAFGKDSPEYEQGWQALLRDCERRVGEAHRVNGWELFAETELDFDPETGDFFCDGFSLSEMLRNGLTPATNPGCPEEPSRRINEFVEVETDVALMSKDYMEGQSTYTFSQCPQSLIDRYQRNPGKRVYSDYVPAIEKLMVRRKRFDTANNKIFMRQMAVPGKYINNEVINIMLSKMRVTEGERQLDRTEVHGTQALVKDETVKDVVDMIRLLDEAASEYHGVPIYLGLPLEHGQKADYEGVYAEADKRRREQESLTESYAARLVELEESGIDREIVKHEADEFIRTELLKIAQTDAEKAEMMFDAETARGFRRANELDEQGRHTEAQDLRTLVERTAPPAGGCGAGSCGLERLSATEEAAAQEVLGGKPGENAVKDTERPCPKCKQKSVVIEWDGKDARTIKKACLSCKATEGAPEADAAKKKPISITIRRPETKQVVTVEVGEQVTVSPKPPKAKR